MTIKHVFTTSEISLIISALGAQCALHKTLENRAKEMPAHTLAHQFATQVDMGQRLINILLEAETVVGHDLELTVNDT